MAEWDASDVELSSASTSRVRALVQDGAIVWMDSDPGLDPNDPMWQFDFATDGSWSVCLLAGEGGSAGSEEDAEDDEHDPEDEAALDEQDDADDDEDDGEDPEERHG